MILRSITTCSFIELCIWCREYHKFTKYPCNTLTRFAIGIYQIYQGMEWKKGPNMWESNAAACIHFICSSESLELNLFNLVNEDIIKWETIYPPKYDQLLYRISKAQQMIFYNHVSNKGIKRSSRFSKEKLTLDMICIIQILLGSIVSYERPNAIWMATDIMTEKL